MLNIYGQLFNRLKEMKQNYFVYKGLSHLKNDLNGERGDIDILVSPDNLISIEKTIMESGFKKNISHQLPFYYLGLDRQSHKFTMLDLDNKIRLGQKPNKPYILDLDIEKMKIYVHNDISILDYQDYIPLMFIYRIVSSDPIQDNLLELQELLTEHKIKEGHISSLIEKTFEMDWAIVYDDIKYAKNWQELQKKYKHKILKKLKIDYFRLIKQKLKTLITLFQRIKNKILKSPPYRVREKGLLIAFLGVDGAGKSSTVDYILGLDYFKYTGIKRIYFGSNEYWIPGLLWCLLNIKNRYIRGLLSIFVHIDKSMRSLIAYFYIQRGFLVLADRFYYDDIIGLKINQPSNKNTKSLIKKIYYKIVKPRIWIKPDMTIFLDVSPDVAHKRKQDYSYERMLIVNNAYKNYMPDVPNVLIVDADKTKENIYAKIVNNILDIDNK